MLHVIKGLGRGGAETLLTGTLRHADTERFAYGYSYFLPWKDALVEELRSLGGEVFEVGSSSSLGVLLSARRLAHLAREWGADLLHCHLPIAGVVGRIAGRLAGIPVLYTEHNVQERYRTLTRLLNRSTWGLQTGVVAVSEEVASSIRAMRSNGVPVEVVHNGVCTATFSRNGSGRAAMRERLGIPAAAPVVGTVAVFRKQKRLGLWLEAASIVHEKYDECHFLLVGDGPLRDEVERQRSRLGLEEVVHLVGLQEDVRPYLCGIDVYLIASRFEGLPVALLEAMAMELPVVATPVGGIPEVVVHGGTGLLVSEPSAASLAEAVSALLAWPARGRDLGREGRRRVEGRFSLARMARRLEEIYLEVASVASRGVEA